MTSEIERGRRAARTVGYRHTELSQTAGLAAPSPSRTILSFWRLLLGTSVTALMAIPVQATVLLLDNFDGENGGVTAANYSNFANWNVTALSTAAAECPTFETRLHFRRPASWRMPSCVAELLVACWRARCF
jgi:hypothetical protein